MRFLYEEKFREANNKGRALSFGKPYSLALADTALFINGDRIPYKNIVDIGPAGSGAYLVYLDRIKVKHTIFLTIGSFFRVTIGRKKKIGRLLDLLIPLVNQPANEVKENEQTTPPPVRRHRLEEGTPDTCHCCGKRGGDWVEYGTVISFVFITRWSQEEHVLCKEHATSEVLKAQLTTGLFGFWGPYGILFTPVFTFKNIVALMKHSTLNRFMALFAGLATFFPMALLIFVIANLE